jgi:hypothetical protein
MPEKTGSIPRSAQTAHEPVRQFGALSNNEAKPFEASRSRRVAGCFFPPGFCDDDRFPALISLTILTPLMITGHAFRTRGKRW